MFRSIYLAAVAACFCVTVNAQKPAYTPEMAAFHQISSDEIHGFVSEMCKPEYNGRLAGSGEYMACAYWAANLMADWGLKPGGDNGSYFQHFPIHYSQTFGPGRIALFAPEGNKEYRISEDYFPGTNSDNGKAKASVIYAGYGLTAPELEYDDYSGIDAKGKIVLIEGGVPCTDRKHKDYKAWNDNYISSTGRIANAVKHGAAGVLLIGKLSNPNIKHQGIIFCHISDQIADDILKSSGTDRKSLKTKINQSMKPASFETKCRVEMATETKYNPNSLTCNVIGVIEGTNPALKDSPLILGAHLDHLGNPGILFPGAWDNASGSSIVLETAKALATRGLQPERPIVIILFSGEECGILGSNYYVTHPLYPLDKTLCMINLDMVGDGDGLFVGGVKSFPALEKYFIDANNNYLHRNLKTSEYYKSTGVSYTDGATFSKADVPTFDASTMGDSGKPMYYHSPEDKVETLSFEIMEDVAKLLYLGISGITTDKNISTR